MKKKLPTFETTLSSKGQIVIGKEIRKNLSLKPNQKFKERIEGKKIIIEPIPTLEELRGSLKDLTKGKSPEKIVREIKKGMVYLASDGLGEEALSDKVE